MNTTDSAIIVYMCIHGQPELFVFGGERTSRKTKSGPLHLPVDVGRGDSDHGAVELLRAALTAVMMTIKSLATHQEGAIALLESASSFERNLGTHDAIPVAVDGGTINDLTVQDTS